ncbi:OLC1v1036122C1 [Oldenlandia corymbosa var. corymbosa]|uniref:OLC1v1036122C1 n=1 Tax=Oldenlandia corymbosa var. corymbosa TaxID=529605 RepID=A0AAV1CUL6_OLDCO|nr:OLC1v1036122C1 [Oldenlandia corymbosa var. corymbosa]
MVEKNPKSGAKKIVEAYGGSKIWKPDYLFVKAPENFCVAWNYRETNDLEAIKDDWTDKEDEEVEEFEENLKKLMKYPKVMSSGNATSELYGDADPLNVVNSDEETSTTKPVVEKKKKKKRIVKDSKKGLRKKSKKNTPVEEKIESAKQGEKTIPPAIEESWIPPTEQSATPNVEEETRTVNEAGPSTKPPVVEKGKGPLEGNVTILPAQLFERGPSAAVYTFSPLAIDCPLLEDFATSLAKADSLKLMSTVMMNCTKCSRDLRQELVEARVERDQAVNEKDVALLCHWPGEELEVPEVPNKYIGTELEEDDDDYASEEGETHNSGAKKDGPPADENAGGAKGNDPPIERASESHPENTPHSQEAI